MKYRQTIGGLNSRPKLDDVLCELGRTAPNGWDVAAQDRGHGEYIENVRAVAAVCRNCTNEEVATIVAALNAEAY